LINTPISRYIKIYFAHFILAAIDSCSQVKIKETRLLLELNFQISNISRNKGNNGNNARPPPHQTTPLLTTNPALTNLPKPIPGSSQLLIKIHASAIQPSDLLNAKGGFAATTYPLIPGRDYAGTIVEPSSRVREVVYGTSGSTQAFTADGSQAEYLLVPSNAVAPKPKSLSFVQAATMGVSFSTAATVFKRTEAKKGESMLVLGANGAVGSAAIQLAAGKGCRVLKGSRREDADVNTASDPSLSAIGALTGGWGKE
jgi:NADPH:quinone reductase